VSVVGGRRLVTYYTREAVERDFGSCRSPMYEEALRLFEDAGPMKVVVIS
jgi:hypothetical protein